MKIKVFYGTPESDVIELGEDQEAVWLEYSKILEEASQARKDKGWTLSLPLYDKADELKDQLMESLWEVNYPELVEDIDQW